MEWINHLNSCEAVMMRGKRKEQNRCKTHRLDWNRRVNDFTKGNEKLESMGEDGLNAVLLKYRGSHYTRDF